MALLVVVSLWGAPTARAFIFVVPAPSYPDTVAVGQTFPAAIGITNASTPPESIVDPVLRISQINHVPACPTATPAANCNNALPEAGVFQLSPTGVGTDGPSCTGTWTITEISPGVWRFTPPGGEGTLLMATGETCIVNFTATTLRVPTNDVSPITPGVQTTQLVTVVPSSVDNTRIFPANSGGDTTTVFQALPGLSTVAAQSGPQIPATTTDTATLSPPPPPSSAFGAPPTGTITFNLFGPTDLACAGPSLFTSVVPVNGFGAYSVPPPGPTITVPGTYRWVATYSGDANYVGSTTACGDPLENVTFAPANAVITTVATPTATPGAPISDTATVTGVPGLPAPTGTVNFQLFNDPTCTTQVFQSSNRPLTPTSSTTSTATSAPFAAPAPDSYFWIATYSGDVNYGPTTSLCQDAGETTVVNQLTPSIVTVATPTATPGAPISDVATVTGSPAPAPAPTGAVDFRLFSDPTCTTEVFQSLGRPLAPSGPNQAQATSATTPAAAPGSYFWRAFYGGDTNYAPVNTPCQDAGETTVVNAITPTIVTTATPTAEVGDPISDVATVTGAPVPAPPPTGTVNFSLFNDPTCTAAPIFTSNARPLAPSGVNVAQATSAPFTTTAPGSLFWRAFYSGDANYAPANTPCQDAGETSVVIPRQPAIVTQALGPVTLTRPIRDTATVSDAVNPTGSVTFTLFGPANPTCTGAPIFTSTVPLVNTGPTTGTATSADFVPVTPGSYQWVAVYSGDANNAPATSPCGAPNETSVVTVLPTIDVQKTADPLTRPEPGGDFTYTVVVTNTSTEVLTITTLTDSVYGNLATRGTCTTAIGTVLAPGGTYTCAFTAPFMGNAGASLTDVVTVTATNPGGVTVSDFDDAVVTLTNVPPTVLVDKTAAPLSRPEPGGDFTYTVVVTNTSNEPVTITTLTDSVYGNLATRGTCTTAIGTVLAASPGPGNTYTCNFTAPFTGNAGDALTDVVTVIVVDDDNTTATDTDDAVVTLTDVLPVITVVKTADPLTRVEPGGDFTFTVVVTNNSIEPVSLTSLNDDVYGNLDGRGTCDVTPPPVLAPAGTYTCSFVGPFTGNAGASQTDTVTATAVDDDNNPATDDDDATVTILNVVPDILVEKDATPASRPEPGGTFTFNVRVTNTSNEPLTITALTDDIYGNIATQGTCTTAIGTVLAPGGTYTCSFPGNFTGVGGASQTDVVTVRGVDDDGTTVTDTDDATVTLTNVPPAVQVVKTADPLTRPEPGGDFTYTVVVTNPSNETVTITSLNDNVYGNLSTRGTCTTSIGTVLAPVTGTYTCTFTGPFTGQGGDSLTDVVTVIVTDAQGTTATDNDDAVVSLTNVLPTVQVVKTASPLSRPEPGGDFTFTVVVTNTSAEPVTITSLTDDVYGTLATRGTCTTAIGRVLAPAGTFTCTFSAPFLGNAGASQTDIVTVVVTDDEGTTATDDDDAVVTITNVLPTVDVVKTADPTSRPEPGGTFTFTVVVTNTSNEPVTITSLTDDVYGNLNNRGTCAIGAVLAAAPGPGNTYTCSFPGNFFGDAGGRQTDIVTVVVVDNDNTTATDNDDATVTITDVPPTIAVVKTASPGTMVAPGGTFTFSVAVTNTSSEAVTITSLTDDVYGNLQGQGSCATGAVLQPGATYTCSFPGEFRGQGGATQTDIVTAVAVDNEGTSATARDDAQVRLEAAPAPRIAFTGSDMYGPAQLAAGLVVMGGFMLIATWRAHPNLLVAGMPGFRWPRGPEPPDAASSMTAFRGPPPRSPGGGGGKGLASGMGLAADSKRHAPPDRRIL